MGRSAIGFACTGTSVLGSRDVPCSKSLPALRSRVMIRRSFLSDLKCSGRLKRAVGVPFSSNAARSFGLAKVLGIGANSVKHCATVVSGRLTRRRCKGGVKVSCCVNLGGTGGVDRRRTTDCTGALTRRLRVYSRGIVIHSACFGLGSRGHKDSVLFCFLVNFVAFINSNVIVCSVFCVSITGDVQGCKRLHAVKAAGQRVGGVICHRKGSLTTVTVPVNLVVKGMVKCFLIPTN